jgi:hypothetical protein
VVGPPPVGEYIAHAARTALLILSYLWAGPVSIIGLFLGALCFLTGGSVRLVDGVLEASGGILKPLLHRVLPGFPIGAITLGHVVLAQDASNISASRIHERAHVAQFARWGFFFPLAYAIASLVAIRQRQPLYRGNKYEREAFERAAGEQRIA